MPGCSRWLLWGCGLLLVRSRQGLFSVFCMGLWVVATVSVFYGLPGSSRG